MTNDMIMQRGMELLVNHLRQSAVHLVLVVLGDAEVTAGDGET